MFQKARTRDIPIMIHFLLQGVIERDQIMFQKARTHDIPIMIHFLLQGVIERRDRVPESKDS